VKYERYWHGNDRLAWLRDAQAGAVHARVRYARFTRDCQSDTLSSELVTTAAIHPNDIAGETPTLSPIAPASPTDLDKQYELGQFLTPNPVAEFMASLFEIHQSPNLRNR
jgi:hypothetical protein